MGQISLMKRITIADSKPTPSPENTRPTVKSGIVVEAVCMMIPMINSPHPVIIAHLLPTKSATSAARMAPTKVPAERIEVTRDWSEEEMMKSASGVAGG